MNGIRSAQPSDIDEIARLWHEGWQVGHADHVPEELTRLRTFKSFQDRTARYLASTNVVFSHRIEGFYIVQESELYQFYVSSRSRGKGLAKILMEDAEKNMKARDISKAWLACAPGNKRAARFYEKQGWQFGKTIIMDVETSSGMFALPLDIYEKQLIQP